MPLTKKSAPAGQDVEQLSPAALYFLMLGRDATVWLPGWVDWAQDQRGTAELRRTYRPIVGDRLQAEAAGFVPWLVSGRRPRGSAVARWERLFLARYPRPRVAVPPVASSGEP